MDLPSVQLILTFAGATAKKHNGGLDPAVVAAIIAAAGTIVVGLLTVFGPKLLELWETRRKGSVAAPPQDPLEELRQAAIDRVHALGMEGPERKPFLRQTA